MHLSQFSCRWAVLMQKELLLGASVEQVCTELQVTRTPEKQRLQRPS